MRGPGRDSFQILRRSSTGSFGKKIKSPDGVVVSEIMTTSESLIVRDD
jgi:hypothetical protein